MVQIANIDMFLKCSYVVEGKATTSTIWLAHFLEHPCRVWYGYPTEVWSKFESSESVFIHVHSRVAYVSANVNFGRMIGINSVYVVVPV